MTHDNDKEAKPEDSPIFSPEDMAARCARLKAEGRMPSLADVLRIMRRASFASPAQLSLPFCDADHEWLRRMGITDRDDA
jgi:hypothetical protein